MSPMSDDTAETAHSSNGANESFARSALVFVAFIAAYFVAYRYGMEFSHATASPFWFPDSVLLCALLLSPGRRWWLFVLATLPVRLWSPVAVDIPLWFLLATFSIDAAKGVLSAAILRRFISDPTRLESVRDFAVYCAVAVLIVPALGATGGAAARESLGDDYWQAWRNWFMGNVVTHLVITPAILYWRTGLPSALRALGTARAIEAGLLASGLVVSGYFAFGAPTDTSAFAGPTFYAPVPFLFWAALRFGMVGASGAIVVVAVIAVAAALGGQGPFIDRSPQETAQHLQQFLLWRAVPLYLVAILMAQQWAIQRSLRESEARFRRMADCMPALIWMSDVDKRCTYVNQRWLDFTGRTHEQESGDGWLECVHPDDRQRFLIVDRAFAAREPVTLEFQLRRHDGEYRWLLNHGVPLTSPDGAFVGYIGSCIDITDRKLAEAEIHRQRMELTHVARVSTVGQLAFTLAHEINQPLAASLFNAEAGERLLRREELDTSELRAILADISQGMKRAGDIVERMRALLKRRDHQFEALDLTQTLEQVVMLVRSDMATRTVTLSLELPYFLPRVRGDRVHLQQVLLNLLANGADAMHDVAPEKRRLELRAAFVNAETVEVTVTDAGPGIPQERLDDIFEPFLTTKPTGMGLGLSICKTILDAHGGRIWATNNPGGGASFHFTLAVMHPTADESHREIVRSSKSARAG